MNTCGLEKALSRLKRSSLESVDNADIAERDSAYFHVKRPIEEELRILLRKVNHENTKSLVMLCGSAGDGKSHLLSYLRHSDQDNENLLNESWHVYNDATESSAPELTSIQTLAEELIEFDDDHFQNNNPVKMILAINLGTLNNFIESAEGKKYSALKAYVIENGIISQYRTTTGYKENSVFQHISFSDYHLFSLTENGATYEYLDDLIERVVNPKEGNPFYQQYQQCNSCPHYKMCPIKHNFEFMENDTYQDAVEYCLLEVEFKDKLILSTRDILDFVYRIIVPPEHEEVLKNIESSDPVKALESYIKATTPMLMFAGQGVSSTIDMVRKYDPLKRRSANIDTDAIMVHSINDIRHILDERTENTQYKIIPDVFNIGITESNIKLKQLLFNFMVRLQTLKDNLFKQQESFGFERYLRFLFYQNNYQEDHLGDLYRITQKAVMQWNGRFDDEYTCIGDMDDHYWVTERLKLEPAQRHQNGTPLSSLVRYTPTLKVRLNKADSENEDGAKELEVDYSLFSLILSMSDGYYPTAHDRNLHADFDSFVRQLLEFGNKGKKITIVSKMDGGKTIFEFDGFKYRFKVNNDGI